MSPSSARTAIDWLSYTIHWNEELLHDLGQYATPARIADAVTFGHTGWVPERPVQHYPTCVSAANRPGLRVMVAERDSQMGVHVSWSGSALATVSAKELLMKVLANGGIVRRIDLAVDIYEQWLLKWFESALENGEAVTRAKVWEAKNTSSGWTIYVGSRTSEKYLRIYDKRAESNLPYDLTRVELECKGNYADGIARYVHANGYGDFPEIIKGFCDFPTVQPWVNAMTGRNTFEGLPKIEKQRDTYKWLLDAVAPSVARLLLEDHEKFVSFLRKVYTIAGVGESAGDVDPFDGAADYDPTPYINRRSREAYKD